MSFLQRVRSSHWLAIGAVIASPIGVCFALAAGSAPRETTFLQRIEAAMHTMMADMAIRPSGNVDADFAAMMIPHHRGAIDMARAELQFGTNEQLRRLAQEIIVDQEQEIAVMRLAVKPIAVTPATSH